MTKLKGILILAIGFFIITAIILGIVSLVVDHESVVEEEQGVSIDVFQPSFYVDSKFNYFTVEENKFDEDVIWFYVYLNDLGLENTVQGYHEHYTLSLTLTDVDDNVYLGLLNSQIFEQDDYFEDYQPYESVRFDLDTSALSNGRYDIRLNVNDLISNTTDYSYSYFVVER